MEILFLALALYFAKNNAASTNRTDRRFTDLEAALHALAQNETFRDLKLGEITLQELSQSLKKAEQLLGENGILRDFLSGKQKIDLQTLLSLAEKLDFGRLAPILRQTDLLSQIAGSFAGAKNNESDKEESFSQTNPFAPIAQIADEEIVFALNRYFS